MPMLGLVNLVYVNWGYQDSLGTKIHATKISNIYKYFELYQVFMHNFLSQNILIFPLLLIRRIDTFWFKSIDKCWPGDSRTFWHTKLHMKNRKSSQIFLTNTNFSFIIFYVKLFWNSYFTYYLLTT